MMYFLFFLTAKKITQLKDCFIKFSNILTKKNVVNITEKPLTVKSAKCSL